LTISVNAQSVFSNITKVDRFDDIIYSKKAKTIIDTDFSDSIAYVSIETKGQNPEKYIILKISFIGDMLNDEPTDIGNGLFGYETRIMAVNIDKLKAIVEKAVANGETFEGYEQLDTNLELLGKAVTMFKPAYVGIVIRTFVTKYTHEYLDELVWVAFDDGDRIIYRHLDE